MTPFSQTKASVSLNTDIKKNYFKPPFTFYILEKVAVLAVLPY